MNEDYLWNKTGEDTDIELLENALQTFRCQKTAPPVLPAKIVSFEPKNPRRFFRFAFAFSACAALIIICLSVWLYDSADYSLTAQGEIKTNVNFTPAAAPIINFGKTPLFPEKAVDPIARTNKKAFVPNYAVERKILKTPNIRRANEQLKTITARNITPAEKFIKLTAEERFAYNRLMLALSITSSKLKIVKDKAEGLSKEENNFSDGK